MRKRVAIVIVIVIAFGSLGFVVAAAQHPLPPLIPIPARLEVGEGVFLLSNQTRIAAPDDANVRATANWLVTMLARSRGLQLSVAEPNSAAGATLVFALDSKASSLDSEAYTVDITPQEVRLTGGQRGLFYAAVTVWQLATADMGPTTALKLPVIHIEDSPRFRWRGLLLDSARHFQSPEFIRSFIDWMAWHKLNVLHWHLTDDQGWRVEIKKYPRLTEVGGWRVPAGAGPLADIDPDTGKPRLYGGYYSQDEIRNIVAYAAARNIDIVPEIGMPGHASAAIAAYPELGVLQSGEGKISSDWGIFPNLYNVEDSTFAFLQDVLTEVLALFPGRYIHIGGDEAVKGQWQESSQVQQRMRELGVPNEAALQGYFSRRIDRFLSAHGRRLIGWDEIIEGGLSADATVMSWRGVAGAVAAANGGHDAVLSPAPDLYLDNRQGRTGDEPPGRGQLIDLQRIYSFDPYPAAVSAANLERIIGVQANLWTEHIRTPERVAYMAYPRAAALAEVAWSAPQHRRWESFLHRLIPMMKRYRALGVGAAESAFAPRLKVSPGSQPETLLASLDNQVDFGILRYTLDGRVPTAQSPRYTAPLHIIEPVTLRAAAFHGDGAITESRQWKLDRQSIWRRADHELRTCQEKLLLSLEDDAPIEGERAVFLVDIMAPCWLYTAADITDVVEIEARVGQVPFNFQIGADRDKIERYPAQTTNGELEVRLDSCTGRRVASLSLASALANNGVSILRGPLHGGVGRHDLCFIFTGAPLDPLWVLDEVALIRSLDQHANRP